MKKQVRRRSLAVLIAVVILGGLAALGIAEFRRPVTYDLASENAAYIELKNGTTGAHVRVTDRDSIRRLCGNFSSVTLVRDGFDGMSTGYLYDAAVYGADGALLAQLSISSPTATRTAHAVSGEFDTDYLDELLNAPE